jgi:hypothetical protein
MGGAKGNYLLFLNPWARKAIYFFYKAINLNDNKKPLIAFTDFSFLRFDFKLNYKYIYIYIYIYIYFQYNMHFRGRLQ